VAQVFWSTPYMQTYNALLLACEGIIGRIIESAHFEILCRNFGVSTFRITYFDSFIAFTLKR